MVHGPEGGFYHKQDESAEAARISTRNRVDALKEHEADMPHESPIFDLAKKEGEFREDLQKENLSKESIDNLADKISNETLEKLEAKKESRYDGLTRLRNRKSFERDGIQILSENRREKKHCSILMIDIDHFKKINDTYGHPAGDEVLRNVASAVKHLIRKSDWAFRYGGEEFTLILPNTTLSAAEYLAERIRSEVQKLNTEHSGQRIGQTLSIGIANTEQVPEWKSISSKNTGLILKQLVAKADDALYLAKSSGRNQVRVSEEKTELKKEGSKN